MKIISHFFRQKKKIKETEPLLKVYSHPRSGTHFLEAFLGKNFYPLMNLEVEEVIWGHWSDRKINHKGNPYGKLFGNHYFPEENKNISPKLYIYRDGRAVAYSVWKTENFLHKELKEYDFNEFLEMKIDWSGSPANEALEEFTILDHWATHVKSWKQFANNNPNVCLIKYEDLLSQPHDEYLRIYNHFQNLFPSHVLKKKDELDRIKEPVGLLPNKAIADAWKNNFSEKNLINFRLITEKYQIKDY